jgi:tellurite methyltransferase
MMPQPQDDLRRVFGEIDIYLFDQLLRGRITVDMHVLDAGCGRGRNLHYFLRRGFDVSAIDESEEAVAHVRELARDIARRIPGDSFRVARVEEMPFADGSFDVVVSSAVLHFARDEEHWWAMVRDMFRVLKPGGVYFARLATSIGHESRIQQIGERRYVLPDGSTRFLVDEELIMRATADMGGTLLDPLKTSVVQDTRSMMTWVVRKNPA